MDSNKMTMNEVQLELEIEIATDSCTGSSYDASDYKSSNSSLTCGDMRAAVHFNESANQVHEIEDFRTMLDLEELFDVWYQPCELRGSRARQLKELHEARDNNKNNKAVENDVMTWRGLEDARDGWFKSDKASWHTSFVVKHARFQRDNHTYLSRQDVEELAQLSRDLSVCDLERALELAAADALEAHDDNGDEGKSKKKKGFRRAVTKGVSHTAAWFKKVGHGVHSSSQRTLANGAA